MERLTYRDNNGIADLKMTNLKDPCEYCNNAIEKLAHYEDLEEQGYKMINMDNVVEQLEYIKMRHFLTMANTGDDNLDFAYEYVGNALDTAIEIVRGGTK